MTNTTQLPLDPEGMDDYRAKVAGCALAHYIELTETDREDALANLLSDLMHLADREAELGGFKAQLKRGRRGYRLETTPDAE